MPEPDSETTKPGSEDAPKSNGEVVKDSEREENLLESRASPTARPLSRGSVSPTRKTISRISSSHSSHLARPYTGSSLHSSRKEGEEDKEDAEDDAGYDTDLEIEVDREEYDTTGKTTYKESCKQFGVIPVSYFLRHMQDPELIMRHHGLGPAGAKAIAVSLVSNTRILKLDLSDNWLSAGGGAAIADMLEENCYITELILSDNKLGHQGAKSICAMLQKNDNITRVNLSGNDFDGKAAGAFAELMTSNTQKVDYLVLSGNEFEVRGGEILGPAIGENTSLKELDLSWNHLRGTGAVAVARGIGANIFLKIVNISWNGMGTDGAIALGEALRINNVLEELDVSNNRIATEGAILLAKGLMVNNNLRILKIGNNPMQTAGAYGVLTGVRQNNDSAIELLDFSSIVVNKDFVELEKEVKEASPKLRIIHGGAESEKKSKPRLDPMTKLRNYIEEKNLRLVDFFNELDADHSMSVTRQELQDGIEQAGIKLTQEEMSHLLNELDKDGDGEINYSELVIGNLEYLQKEKIKREQDGENTAS